MVVLPSVTRSLTATSATTLTAVDTQVLDDSATMGRCTQKAVHQSVAQVLANERCLRTERRNLHEWIRRAGNVTSARRRNTCNCGNAWPICHLCNQNTPWDVLCLMQAHAQAFRQNSNHPSMLPGTCLDSKQHGCDPPPQSRDVLGRLSGLKDTFTDVSPCNVSVVTQSSMTDLW